VEPNARLPAKLLSGKEVKQQQHRKANYEVRYVKKLYVSELRDLYNAENQLLKALPKMAKATSSEELKDGFENIWNRQKGM
jgi:Domain of unknown function (DUF892)